jgi:hypothetical protein
MNENENLELWKSFLDFLNNEYKKAQSHKDFNIEKNNHHLLSKEAKKGVMISKYLNLLSGLLEDLRKIKIFIRRYPFKKFYKENEINELDYIKYHYEVFLHKIHTILEVKKLAINDYYNIGLKEKDCTWNNLKNQPKLKNSPLKLIIENYFKTFEHLIEHRNLNTHRAIFADEKNKNLNTDLMLYENAEKYGIELNELILKLKPKFLIEYKIGVYKKEKLEYITSGIEAVEHYVKEFNYYSMLIFMKSLKNKNSLTK